MDAARPALSLADLESFDPDAPCGGRERRFLCPLPGPCADKPRDRAHRSLSVNTETGLWNCQRCQAAGKLAEFRDGPPARRAIRARQALRRAFAGPDPRPPSTHAAAIPDLERRQALYAGAFSYSPGADYLRGRGIPAVLAALWKCGYCPLWEHWEKDGAGRWVRAGVSRRVTFPARDLAGRLVALQGRAVHPQEFGPSQITRGPKCLGVFATADALAADPLILVEAPIDALSLAACGYPSVAVFGCQLPAWLPQACAGRHVLAATDADPAGDAAAVEWARLLRGFARTVERLRPAAAKDWNDLLMADRSALRAALKTAIPPIAASLPPCRSERV